MDIYYLLQRGRIPVDLTSLPTFSISKIFHFASPFGVKWILIGSFCIFFITRESEHLFTCEFTQVFSCVNHLCIISVHFCIIFSPWLVAILYIFWHLILCSPHKLWVSSCTYLLLVCSLFFNFVLRDFCWRKVFNFSVVRFINPFIFLGVQWFV